MPHPTLHYIHDPFCGWCYAAVPLLSAALQIPGLQIVLHAGGMMSGANRQQVTPQLRSYVMQHDANIARITGQPFGDAYFNGLLLDQNAVFDSTPPITAILAADALGGHGLELLKRIQTAHYVEGRKIAEFAILQELAIEIGLDADAFNKAFQASTGAATERHLAASRHLLQTIGGRGFPTLALEIDGKLERLDISAWLGNPQGFAQQLKQALPANTNAKPAEDFSCRSDSCGLPE